MEAADYERIPVLWRRQDVRTGAEMARAMGERSVAFAYHSGRIENERVTYWDMREIFEHDSVSSYTGDLRTLFELRNARDAHELFLRFFEERRALDEGLILELQECLTKNTYDARRWQLGERPGHYKRGDWVVGRNEAGTTPEDARSELLDLLAEVRSVPEGRVLTAAAYFHAVFESIHPFADGNGRVGRMAMNCLLVLHDHPPVIVHEEDRKDYYAALEAWDTDQDLAPLVELLRAQTVKTWEKRLLRAMGEVGL